MKQLLTITLSVLIVSVSLAQDLDSVKVYFKLDDATLDSRSRAVIDNAIQDKTFLAIEIHAHCDSLGSHAYNDRLSLKRAHAVELYLESKQVADTLISIQALGKRFPVNSNKTKLLRAQNRRAELLFLIKKKAVATTVKTDSILNLEDVEVGTSIRLDRLHFIGGRHYLLPESQATLERLYHTLKEYKTLEIEIQGHICCEDNGIDGYDFDTGTRNLSENRAIAIYDYLINRGIKSYRLSYKGFASTHKLTDEKTEEDKTMNRRVELKIIRK